MREIADFDSEADLCTTFIKQLPEGWAAYPECGGFDILLVREKDGCQIGIEAKMTLNAKVILQARQPVSYWSATSEGPDYRAVLVPWGRAGSDMKQIAGLLGITVIEMASKKLYQSWTKHYRRKMRPDFPSVDSLSFEIIDWIDCCPVKRIALPGWIPDVTAGASAPMQLSDWKIKAIKLVIILEKRGYIMRTDFKALQINPGRWIYAPAWLDRVADDKGKFVRGRYMPDFRVQHPVNYAQIEADIERWLPKEIVIDAPL